MHQNLEPVVQNFESYNKKQTLNKMLFIYLAFCSCDPWGLEPQSKGTGILHSIH